MRPGGMPPPPASKAPFARIAEPRITRGLSADSPAGRDEGTRPAALKNARFLSAARRLRAFAGEMGAAADAAGLGGAEGARRGMSADTMGTRGKRPDALSDFGVIEDRARWRLIREKRGVGAFCSWA